MFKNIKRVLISYWPLFVILLVAGSLFFFQLGREPLWDWDECIYTQYGKEMKSSGNFLTNQWNGGTRLEKPPGYSILLQLPFAFGINEFSSRFLAVLMGLGLIAAVYILARKYFSQEVAILSSLLLLTSEAVVIYSLRANTELAFALCVVLGVYFWLRSDEKKSLSYVAGVFFGIGVMIKGLAIQFLPPLFLSVFIDFKKERFLNFLRVLAAFLVVIAPWHIMQFLQHGNHFYQIYIYENIIKKVDNPVEFHFGGRLFYFKLFFQELYPWVFFVLVLPVYYLLNLKKFLNKKNFLKEIKNQRVLACLLLFVVIPLALLTRAQTKIAWYTLSIYPFLSIILAYSISLFFSSKKLKPLFYVLMILVMLDAGRLMINETRLTKSGPDISPRYKTLKEVAKVEGDTLDYLVQYSERRGWETLSKNLTTSTTFIYGGNPCAVYYTGKKVNYYYEIKKFQERVKKGGGLYLLENGDLWTVKDLPVKKIYGNLDFTLFRN